MLSTCYQTNEGNAGHVSGDFLWFSRIQSLHRCLEVDFHDEEDELISSTLHNRRKNIFPGSTSVQVLFPIRNCSWGRASRFLFFVVLLWPLIGMQNLSHPVLTHILRSWTSGIHCSLLFKFITNLYLIHEKFWLRSEYCLCSKTQFWAQLHTYHASNWLQLLLRAQSLCSLGSNLSVQMFLLLLGRVYSRQATAWNCENYAVSFVMKYCPISTIFRNPASIQNLLNLSCCDSFSIRSPYCCNRRSWLAGSSQSKGTSVLITLGTSEELDCPITTGLSVLSLRVSYSSHISATGSVKTELVCRDNYAKNSLNRFPIGCIVYRQFSMPFASESTSGQWARSAENWTITFCEFPTTSFQQYCPILLVDCLHWYSTTSFQNQDQ